MSPSSSTDIIFISKDITGGLNPKKGSQISLFPNIRRSNYDESGKSKRPDSVQKIKVKSKVNREKGSKVRGSKEKLGKHGGWESDFRLPDGLTFEEIG